MARLHLRQLRILLWKNLVLKRRHYIVTFFELFIPLLLFGGLLYIRSLFKTDIKVITPPDVPMDTSMGFFDKESVTGSPVVHYGMYSFCTPKYHFNTNLNYSFYVVAKKDEGAFFSDLPEKMNLAAEKFCQHIGKSTVIEFLRAQSEAEIVSHFRDYRSELSEQFYDPANLTVVLGGAILSGSANSANGGLGYTLRFGYGSFTDETKTEKLYRASPGSAQIYSEQFEIAIQTLLDLLFIQGDSEREILLPVDKTTYENSQLEWTLSDIPMAISQYQVDYIIRTMILLTPLFSILSFLFVLPAMLKRIVHEKESGVKEFIRMMGLPMPIHWLGWFLTAFLSCFVTIAIATLILTIHFDFGAIIKFTNPILVLLTYTIYSVALIVMMFAITALFNNANLALTVGVVLHLVSFIYPFGRDAGASSGFREDIYQDKTTFSEILNCLSPNTALLFALVGIFNAEEQGQGLAFADLFTPFTNTTVLSLGLIWAMFLADAVLFGLVIWYVDNVKPGPYGVAKPPYFFFLPSYWCSSHGQHDTDEVDHPLDEHEHSDSFEDEPDGVPGVKVRSLRKVFRSFGGGEPVYAVNNATFSAYPDQIMALLGHNGAGKTTTMSILTGLFSSSGGQALVNGYDIKTDMEQIRGCIGLCPQHNMLFDGLTVKEHLVFFGMLKNMSKSEAEEQAESVGSKVMLKSKMDSPSSALSGGMKRKLHLGISLMADSKVVLLDEPTSGLDPEARREIWDLLQGIRKDRTIILTTHFMEEADVLGDRIAIMAEGKVQCYGTSLFLKKTFGSGYRLTISKARGFDDRGVKLLIRQHVPAAKTISNATGELAMSLPSEQEQHFVDLLKMITAHKTRLGISSFGLSVTTLEDVFLRVGTLADNDDSRESDEDMVDGGAVSSRANNPPDLERMLSADSHMSNGTNSVLFKPRQNQLSGIRLWFLQMKGLLIKRAIQTRQNWLMYTLLALVPILMTLGAVLSINYSSQYSQFQNLPALKVSLTDYKQSVTLVNKNNDHQDFLATLSGQIQGQTSLIDTQNITGYIFNRSYSDEDFEKVYRKQFVVGFAMGSSKSDWPGSHDIVGQYSLFPTHSRPLARNIMSNALYRVVQPQAKGRIAASYLPMVSDSYKLRIFSSPSPESDLYISSIIYPIMLSVGWLLFLGGFIIFPIRERLTNAKQVQLMAGVHPVTFWLSNLLWDLLLFLLVTLAMTLILSTLDELHIFNANRGGWIFLMLQMLFGLGGISLAYLFSLLGKAPSTAFALFIVAGLITGFAIPLVLSFVPKEADDSPNSKMDTLRYVSSLIPFTVQATSLTTLTKIQEVNNICINNIDPAELADDCASIRADPSIIRNPAGQFSMIGHIGACCTDICGKVLDGGYRMKSCYQQISLFTFDEDTGANQDIIYLAVDALLLFTLLILLEIGLWRMLKQFVATRYLFKPNNTRPDDEDVRKEQEVAQTLYDNRDMANDSALVVKDLAKTFGLTKKFKAVDELSFTVKQGECFGLLGVNGAGKTTTFRMLTGDETLSSGEAVLHGHDLRRQRRSFLKHIGYCPQFDSIINVLTGRDILNLFARIRGVPESKRRVEVAKWIEFVGLQQYADRKCGDYSGGNKRKLNVAQALVGDPPIIFLDEPSTGVDPAARRKLWDAIGAIKKNGQSVVLTSHSMEECEALCNRLAIMVQGQFCCLGGPQHLKNKFGQGFTIIVKLFANHQQNQDGQGMSKVTAFLRERLDDCTIKDEHQDYIHYHIGEPSTPWYLLFYVMQAARQEFPFIQDYSISETSLEQVFLQFAKNQ